MKLIDASVRHGVGVVVGMILVMLFGLLALGRIPVQLNPTIETPIITVETDYPGAAPAEVETEVTRRIEEKLAIVENVRKMTSISSEGESSVTLEFDWGVDKDLARLEVSEKLNLVGNMPEDVEESQIFAADSEENRAILRITVQSDLPVNEERELLEDLIGPRLERVEGVGIVRWYGGSRRQIQVLVDLAALESRHVSINEVLAALRAENRNVRGGRLEGGDSRLLVRTVGEFSSLDEVRRVIVAAGPEGPIRIGDIAEVADAWSPQERVGRTNGEPGINMSIAKKSGANTLTTVAGLRREVEAVNRDMAARGVNLWITYDAGEYIRDAIAEVRDSLVFGAVLATVVLLLFLRSIPAVLSIGVMIPVCTVGTFVLLAAFGRSVNVISLAGLAFASGMVVDNGIVVVENIHRHRREFRSDPFKAAREAAAEVWAPLLASTLTTLAVFIPILFIREEAGQLFRDIAYSISFAVGLSMLASITIVPMIVARLDREDTPEYDELDPANSKRTGRDGRGEAPVEYATGRITAALARAAVSARAARANRALARARRLAEAAHGAIFAIGSRVGDFFTDIVRRGLEATRMRVAIVALIAAGFFGSLWLAPPAEYLPQSRSTFLFGNITIPSGASLSAADALVSRLERYILESVPNMVRAFMVAGRDGAFYGVFFDKDRATDAQIEKAVADIRAEAARVFPSDVRNSVARASDFGWRGQGKGASIDLRGPDVEVLRALADELEDRLAAFPEVVGVMNSLRMANPELRVSPDRDRLADLGLTASDLGVVVETAVEGTLASLYRADGKEFDLVLKAREGQIHSPEELRALTIQPPGGADVRIDEVARVERTLGPVSILRIEQERAITLDVSIDEHVPLETFLQHVESEALDPLRAALPPGYYAQLSGSADDLRRTVDALSGSFLLALLIIYLLMAALFESFAYPLVVMLSVPLSMTGAFLGVRLAGAEFNVITMLGFVLLAGTVVNNAILLVEFAIEARRGGATIRDAVLEGVRVRMRPIFMTSATTVLGMAPLVIGAGAGTELYRGLGAAVIGGMSLSTIFTLVLVPLVLAWCFEAEDWLGRRLAWIRGARAAS